MESERYELYNSYLFSQKGKRCVMDDLISRQAAIDANTRAVERSSE